MKILVVRLSALGDVIQGLPVATYLRQKFPDATIDWVIGPTFFALIDKHPHIDKAISIRVPKKGKNFLKFSAWKNFFKDLSNLKKERYDLLFDLQGNCKSGCITLIAKADQKVGYDKKGVKEWPNTLATTTRFHVDKNIPIINQYLGLAQAYFEDDAPTHIGAAPLLVDEVEKKKAQFFIDKRHRRDAPLFLICPGSAWENKRLGLKTIISLAKKISCELDPFFLLIWGSDKEKEDAIKIDSELGEKSIVVDRLAIPTWQYLMSQCDLAITVDSSALHLAAIAGIRTFSLFGASSATMFKPPGDMHLALQGPCPYNKTFIKRCPHLRTCPTGSCMKDLKAESLFESFMDWWQETPLTV